MYPFQQWKTSEQLTKISVVVVDVDVSSMGHICCDLRIVCCVFVVCAKAKQALALVPLHRTALMTGMDRGCKGRKAKAE